MQRVDKCLLTSNVLLTSITETREWTECRALQKRDSCGKISKSICLAPLRRQKQRIIVGQCLKKELKKSKKSKFEMELLKIRDCFLDGHGNYGSNLVSFKTESLLTNKSFCYSLQEL